MKTKRRIIFLILMLSMIFLSVPVYGKTYEKTFTLDSEISNCIFQVYWTNGDSQAEVELTDPAGKVFNKGNLGENYFYQKGLIRICMPKAIAGNWKFNIKGEDLGKINFEAGELPKYALIKEFSVSKVYENKLNVKWKVLDSNGSIKFKLYADRMNYGNGGMEIASFNGSNEGSMEITTDKISPGEYYLLLKAVDDSGFSDFKYSDAPLTLSNTNAPKQLNSVRAIILNNEIFIRWDKDANIQSYKVMIFKPSTLIPIHEAIAEQNYYTFAVSDELGDKLEVAVSAIKGELSGAYTRINVNTKPAFKYDLKLPEGDKLNKNSILVPITFDKSLLLDVYINDKYYVEGSSKQGNYKVDLLDGENKIGFVFTDKEGNKKVVEKNYYVDTYAPQITFYNNIDGKKVTSNTIYVSGNTEPASILNINGRRISLTSNGNFESNIKLKPGVNRITISSIDAAGNEARLIATVTFDVLQSIYFYLLLIGFIIFILALYYIFIIIKSSRNNKKLDN